MRRVCLCGGGPAAGRSHLRFGCAPSTSLSPSALSLHAHTLFHSLHTLFLSLSTQTLSLSLLSPFCPVSLHPRSILSGVLQQLSPSLHPLSLSPLSLSIYLHSPFCPAPLRPPSIISGVFPPPLPPTCSSNACVGRIPPARAPPCGSNGQASAPLRGYNGQARASSWVDGALPHRPDVEAASPRPHRWGAGRSRARPVLLQLLCVHQPLKRRARPLLRSADHEPARCFYSFCAYISR